MRRVVILVAEADGAVCGLVLANVYGKSGYGFISFPGYAYGTYGYENYFMACALYPEVIERHFSLQADLALRINRAAARAFIGKGVDFLLCSAISLFTDAARRFLTETRPTSPAEAERAAA